MAHGLVLRMQDYLEKLDTRKEISSNEKKPVYVPRDPDQSSEVVQIIRSWVLVTKNSKNSKMEFYSLLRQTLLFMLSSEWSTCLRKNDLLHAYGAYYQKFSSITKNAESVYIAVIQLSNNPWQNSFFRWDDLTNGEININYKNVQSYFRLEPEEIVLARVQSLASRGKIDIAMHLAKLCFLYQSRIRKSLAQPKSLSSNDKEKIGSTNEEESREGQACIDWYMSIIRRKSLQIITEELSHFTCHEGIEIICRIKKNARLKKFILVVMKIFLLQELVKPSTFCCTKKLFQLFCQVHKDLHSSEKEIIESARKIFAVHAPTSSHLYLFVDAMWEHFGLKFNSLIQVYTEFYVRGLTADINYLEAARNSDVSCDISGLESHIASIFIKLATLFRNSSEEATRECTFSAFSLRPSKSKLVYLKNLNQSVQSKLAELSENVNHPDLAFRDCTCSRICNGYCRITTIDHNFVHPLLKKGIRNISYSLVKDLVCVLESVRIINFQYNLFNWNEGILALSSHLQSRMVPKAPKSRVVETLQESDPQNSLKSNIDPVQNVAEAFPAKMQSPQALIKRKHTSEESNQSSFLDVGANIEVEIEDSFYKKIKVSDSVTHLQNAPELSENFNSKLKVSNAIEQVIRLSLTNKMTQEGLLNPIESINSSLSVSQNFTSMQSQQKDTLTLSEQFKQIPTSSNNFNNQLQLEIPKPQLFDAVEKSKPIPTKQTIERPSVLFKTNDTSSEVKASHFQTSDRQLSSMQRPAVPSHSVNSVQSTSSASNFVNDIPPKLMPTSSVKAYSANAVQNLSSSSNSVSDSSKQLMPTSLVKTNSNVTHSVCLPQGPPGHAIPVKPSSSLSHYVTPNQILQKPVVQTSLNNSNKFSNYTVQSGHRSEYVEDSFKSTSFQSKPLDYVKSKSSRETFTENVSALNLSSKPSELEQQTNFNKHTYEGQNFRCNKSSITERIINSSLNEKSAKLHDIKESSRVSSSTVSTYPGLKQQSDRNSVIQHTMQHLGIKIPTQLSVSLNTNSSEPSKALAPTERRHSNSLKTNSFELSPRYSNLNDNHQQSSLSSFHSQQDQYSMNVDRMQSTTIPSSIPAPTSVIKRKASWHAPSVYDKGEVKKAFHSTTSTTKESYSVQKERFADSTTKEYRKKTEITKRETVYQIYKTKQNKDSYIKSHHNPMNVSNYREPSLETSSYHLPHHTPNNRTTTSANINTSEDRLPMGHIRSKSSFESPSVSYPSANSSTSKNSIYFSKDISDGKTKLFRVDPYSKSPVQIKAMSTTSSSTKVFSKQTTSHTSDRPSVLKPSLSPSPTPSNSNIYKMHNSILKTKTSQSSSVVNESLLRTHSPMAYSPAPSSASSINLASNTNSPVPWDSSRSNSSYYDPSLYSSSSVILEDDKGVVVFKAANNASHSSQPSIEQPKTCCSPLEVNPCQTCSVSSEYKHSGSSNSVVEIDLPSSADNSVNLVPEFPPEITITRNNEKIPARSNEFKSKFDNLEDEKYTTCHICSVSCAISELNTHYGNCHPYELIKKNTSDKINAYDLDSSSLGCLIQDSEKVIYKDHFAKKTHKIKTEEIVPLQNDLDDCINLMSSSSFDDIEMFGNVNNPDSYSNPRNYKFSGMLKDNLESDSLVNSGSLNSTQITEDINLMTPPTFNKAKENNSLNEMIEYLTSQTVEVSPFNSSKLGVSPGNDFQILENPNGSIKSKSKPNYNPSKHIHCKLCTRKYSTTPSFTKHAKALHPNARPREIMVVHNKPLKSVDNVSTNMSHSGISNNNRFHETQVDAILRDYQVNKNVHQMPSSNLEGIPRNMNSASMPLIPFMRKQKKATLKECTFCGAMLTTTFMKQHMLRYHSSIAAANNNGGSMSFSGHSSKASYQSKPSAISIPDLQDNIDSNTCLSISDALHTNEKFSNLNTDIDFQNQMVNIKQEPIDFHLNEEKPTFQVDDYLPNFQMNQSTISKANSNVENLNSTYSYEPSVENSYTCNICMRNYTSQSFLNKHIRTYHGIQNLMESQSSGEAQATNVSDSNSIVSIPQSNSELFGEGFDTQNISQNYDQNDFDLLNSLEFDSVNNQNESKFFTNPSSLDQTPNEAYLSNSLAEIKIENPEVTPFWENMNQPHLNSWQQDVLNPAEIISNQKDISAERHGDNFPQHSSNDGQINQNLDISYKSENTPVLKEPSPFVDSNLNTLSDKNNLNMSLSSKQQTTKFPCQLCQKSFTSNYFLERHKALKHNASNLNDSSCLNDNILNTSKVSPRSTVRADRKEPKIVISPKKESLDLKDLLSFSKGSLDRVKCKICGQYCSHRGNLKNHMIKVHKMDESELITRRRLSSHDINKMDDSISEPKLRRRLSSQDSNKMQDSINESMSLRRLSRESNIMSDNRSPEIALTAETSKAETQIHQEAESNITNSEGDDLKSNEPNADVPFDSSNLKSSARVRCKLCLKVYSNRGSLRTHMKTIHPNDSVKQIFSKEYEKRGKITKKRVQCSICMKLLWNTSMYLHMKIIHTGLKYSQSAQPTIAPVVAPSVPKENYLDYIKSIANRNCAQPVNCSSSNPDDKKITNSNFSENKNVSATMTSVEPVQPNSFKINGPTTSSTISTFCENLSDDSDSLPPLDELTPFITEFSDDSKTTESFDDKYTSMSTTDIDYQCKKCLDDLIQSISQNLNYKNILASNMSDNKSTAKFVADFNDSTNSTYEMSNDNSNISDPNLSNLLDQQAYSLNDSITNHSTNSDAVYLTKTSKTGFNKKLNNNIDLISENLDLPNTGKKRWRHTETKSNKQSVAKDKASSFFNKKSCEANENAHQPNDFAHRNECRVCHKMFKSMMLLSKHLKIVHNIPYLKKLKTAKLKLDEKDSERLSPPPLTYKNFDVDSASQFTEGPQIFVERSSCSTVIEEEELTPVSNESGVGSNDFTRVCSEMSSIPCSRRIKRAPSEHVGVSLRKRRTSTSNHSLSNSDFNENFDNVRYNFRDVAAYSSFSHASSNSDRNKATNGSKFRHHSGSDKSKGTNCSDSPVQPVVIKLLRSGENFTIENNKCSQKFRLKLKKKNGVSSNGYTFHNSTSDSFLNPPLLTLKYPDDVSNFLKQNKQPSVQLTRLDDHYVEELITRKAHLYANSSASNLNCNTKIGVLNNLETIDDKFPNYPVPKNIFNSTVFNDAVYPKTMSTTNQTQLSEPVIKDSPLFNEGSHAIGFISNQNSSESNLKDSSLVNSSSDPGEIVKNRTFFEPVSNLSLPSQATKGVAVVLRKLKLEINNFNNYEENFSNYQLNCTEEDSDTSYYLKFPFLKECRVILNKL